jgi:cyclophilin family peptidyl-prolyl cis-trans isomerase
MDKNTLPFIFIIPAVVIIGFGIYLYNKSSMNPVPETNNDVQPTVNIFNTNDAQTPPTTSEPMKQSKKQIKQYAAFPGVLSADQLENKKAVIKTNKGTIEFEILPEAPKAASNFIFLTKDGFYNGLTFHRVVPGFVIQGGDPLGNGMGGPGYKFEDEPVTRQYDKGIVAMANSGPNTNGSQFFIMLDHNDLPPSYTIFGKVISGQDVVDKIAVGDVMETVTIEDNK